MASVTSSGQEAVNKDQEKPKRSTNLDERSSFALRAIGVALIVNLAVIFLRGCSSSNTTDTLTYSAGAFVVACASLLVGILVGFLFGIPRAMAQPEANTTIVKKPVEPSTSLDDNDEETEDRRSSGYGPNTNLEQISDWLTKILVGVGLTNLSQIPSALTSLSAAAAPAFGTFSGNNVYALAVMLFFSVCGFLIGFLWARIYLPLAFALLDIDVSNLSQRLLQRVDKKIDKKIDEKAERDLKALRIVQRQLDLPGGTPDLPQEDLDRALEGISPTVLEQIYYRARNIRHDNWNKPDNLQLMERTIPIFKALNAEDKTKKFHTILGQLGFALADKRVPDFPGAIQVLTEAIGRRGSWQKSGWVHYELVRATSRIGLLSQESSAPSDAIALIIEDLRVIARSELADLLVKDANIKSFLERNDISMESLRNLSQGA